VPDAQPRISTTDQGYTERLLRQQDAWWKRVVDVRGIYGWNLRRLNPGFTLDVGCGLGRNLAHLRGAGVGVDHNAASVEVCRSRGFEAFTPDEFRQSKYAGPGRFHSLLLAHVVEHMTFEEAVGLIGEYLPSLDDTGQVILVTPQEAGYKTDPTHVEFVDFSRLAALFDRLGLDLVRSLSFPLPHKPFGRLFRYNEFVVVGRRRP